MQLYSPYYPSHFAVGILIHAARAQWLHDGRAEDSRWREQMEKTRMQVEAEDGRKILPSDFAAAVHNFEGYIAYWKLRPFPTTLAVEYELKPRGLQEGAPEWAYRTARLDSIERWQGKVWIGECKTTSSGAKRVGDIYALHGQVLLQAALWGQEETEKFGPLSGVLLDIITKAGPKERAHGNPRHEIPMVKIQYAVDWFKRNFHDWVMQSAMVKWNNEVERRITACVGTFGPCPYRDLCMKGRNGSLRYVYGKDRKRLHEWKPEPGREVPPWA